MPSSLSFNVPFKKVWQLYSRYLKAVLSFFRSIGEDRENREKIERENGRKVKLTAAREDRSGSVDFAREIGSAPKMANFMVK